MRAALISLGSTSSQWTLDAMKKHFDSVHSLNLRRFEIAIGRNTQILYDGKPFEQYDCVYAKGSHRYADMLSSITAYCKDKTYLPYKTQSFSVAHDKILTHIYLQKFNVPQPQTYLTSGPKAAKKIINKMNYPIIMKLPRGTQGKGVMFADSYASASSVLDTLDTLRQPFLIQEYIETDGEDIRAIVVGDKVVAAMKRIACTGEKRSNIHAGGTAKAFSPDSYTQKIAVAAAKAIGADICGIDILETVKGPVVIEANISPGLQGITEATGIDIAGRIARFLADRTRQFLDTGKEKTTNEIMEGLQVDQKEIIGTLECRGSRIILPEIVTKIAKLSEDDEIIITVDKGNISIRRFSL